MNGRSSSSLRWHLGHAARGIAAARARKGDAGIAADLAFFAEVAAKFRANRKALDAGLPLPFPPNPNPKTSTT